MNALFRYVSALTIAVLFLAVPGASTGANVNPPFAGGGGTGGTGGGGTGGDDETGGGDDGSEEDDTPDDKDENEEEDEEQCDSCASGESCSEGVSVDNQCVSFSQKFGRTPLVAGAPVGAIRIREPFAHRLPGGADVLRYDHPLLRRVVDRDDDADRVTVEQGNGRLVTYRGGVPVGRSSGLDSEIRRDPATGLFVERLRDRTTVFYDARGGADHVVTPAGTRLDWTNAGIEILYDGFAIAQVRSLSDGLMDVEKLSRSSFRLSWFPPSAVSGEKDETGRFVAAGNPAKTFTFAYSRTNGIYRYSLRECRNETFCFDYLWTSENGRNWTLVRDPDGLALCDAVSVERAPGTNRVVRTLSDAAGSVIRRTTTLETGPNGNRVIAKGVLAEDGTETVHWRASRIPSGRSAGRVASRVGEYGGAVRYAYDDMARRTNETQTVSGGLLQETSVSYSDAPDDGFADRRPVRRVVRRDGVVVSDTSWTHGFAPDGGRVETTTRSDPVSGDSLVSSRTYYPPDDSNTAAAGRLRLEVHEDGAADLHAYAALPGGGYAHETTRGFISDPAAASPDGFRVLPGRSTRTVETFDFRGDAVRTDESVHDGTDWTQSGWTQYVYNLTHKRTGFLDHKGDRESSEWICTGPVWIALADGTTVSNSFDKAKRLVASVRTTPFGAVRTDYALDAAGKTVGTTVSTNGVAVFTTSAAYDARGRLVRSVDPRGGVSTVSRSTEARTETRTSPSGASETTEFHEDGSVASFSGNVRPRETRLCGVDAATGLAWTEIRTAQDGAFPSVLSSKTWTDALGRTVRRDEPAPDGSVVTVSLQYDSLGRVVSETATDAVGAPVRPAVSYEYDAMGRVVRTARTVPSGAWRAENALFRYETDPADGSVRETALSFATCSDFSLPVATNRVETRLFPLSPSERARVVAFDPSGNATIRTESFDRAAARTEKRTWRPWSPRPSLSVSVAGLDVRSVSPAGVTNTWARDALGRVVSAADGAGNETRFVYDAAGDLVSKTDPAGFSTTLSRDAAGRVVARTDALGAETRYGYDPAGRRISEDGATYPVRSAFDAYGRRVSLLTTRDGLAWDATAWTFDEATGLQTAKTYADGTQTLQTWDAGRRPVRTTWARGAWRQDDWNEWGEASATRHDDPARDFSVSRDAFGRMTGMASAETPSGSGSSSFTFAETRAFDAEGRVTNETASVDGVSAAVERAYDAFGRLSSLRVAGTDYTQTFSYDDAGRLAGISSPGVAVSYDYTPDSLDAGCAISFAGGATLRRAVRREPLRRGLVLEIENVSVAADGATNALPSFRYARDALGRPVSRNSDAFSYNARGEVASASLAGASEPDRYAYDCIGNFLSNRLQGVSSRYAANALNEYAAIASGDGSAETTRLLAYDPDGNLLTNGVWSYAWDSENRLSSVFSNGVETARFAYDAQSRRIRKTTPSATHVYLYDGWNPIRETVVSGGSTNVVEYYWGKDLSGSLQGAGGVGGLFAVRRDGESYAPVYDDLGNVAAYVSSSGAIAAAYAYDAFGRLLAASGPLADAFPHR
ncbi:MAG: RHS repeat protein, partial [Kiritimatiellae bacterium]|nr:RHS repeat protein [Kiritimatiellia bacterium]